MATYTQNLEALNARLDALTNRVNEIDNNTIGHLNRILENQARSGSVNDDPIKPGPQPTPEPTPTPQPTERPGLAEERATMSSFRDVATAGRFLENYYNTNFRDMYRVDNICLVINERWPSEWRNLPQAQRSLIEGQLHALGGQGV